MILVVAAAIFKENKVLLAQRADGDFENKWEFPGGKVEKKETEKNALKREIREELGVEIEVQGYIANNVYKYPNITIDLKLYCAEIFDDQFDLSVHKAVKWVDKEDLLDYDLAPADIKLAKYVKEN